MKQSLLISWMAVAMTGAALANEGESAYDPFALQEGEIAFHDLAINDANRDREIPVRIYLPPNAATGPAVKPAPVVLFSHGLGGSRENNRYYADQLTRRGYVAVFLQHPGSDESVWRDVPAGGRRQAMNEAASGENMLLRNGDVSAVIDSLEQWNAAESGHELSGRLDLEKIAISGHSFGAVTSQAVIGQRFGLAGARFEEPRLKAAILMSPSMPERGTPEETFAEIKKPVLCLTGTRDTSAVRAHVSPENRTRVYAGLAPGDHYQLVLDEAEHMAFSDRPLRGGEHRNPGHHRRILAACTAFLDAYLRGNEAAGTWLKSEGGFAAILDEKDRWEWK